MHRTYKYTNWINEASLMAQMTTVGSKRIKPPFLVDMVITGGSGWRKDRDLDNAIKPVLDLLISLGFIEDDNCSLVNAIRLRFEVGNGSDAICNLEITENR